MSSVYVFHGMGGNVSFLQSTMIVVCKNGLFVVSAGMCCLVVCATADTTGHDINIVYLTV